MNLDILHEKEMLRTIDLVFARMIQRLDPRAAPGVALAAALVSRATTSGDVCLDVAQAARDGIQGSESSAAMDIDISLEQWLKDLNSSQLVGRPGENTPMILDGRRLYLQRYWHYEQQVARAIRDRCTVAAEGATAVPVDRDVFMGDADQLRAVELALERMFTVISGGPGTGKTYTIARIISLMQSAAGGDHMKIHLAAPTGKAAARLQDSLEDALEGLTDRSDGEAYAKPELEAQTLHRMLGAVPGNTRYRFHAGNPLPADVVIVDEASMVDMAMMAKLMQAVPPRARLILVGDKDQLASVEAGAVLGDICHGLTHPGKQPAGGTPEDSSAKIETAEQAQRPSPIVVLKTNYRFGQNSDIQRLGLAVNRGDSEGALAILESGSTVQLDYQPMGKDFSLEQSLGNVVQQSLAPVFTAGNPEEALRQLSTFKILTPVRKGPFGVEGLNALAERHLKRIGLIRPLPSALPWYAGRPVMITRNDYHHHLYNGDIGITTVNQEGDEAVIRIAFPAGRNDMVHLSPEQLPEHETVWAMTVHKSQGTEFDRVLLVLPDRDAPVLTRELIYTAITRARKHVVIWSDGRIFKLAVKRRIRRASGLREALQSQTNPPGGKAHG